MQARLVTIAAGERLSTVEDIMTLWHVRHMPVVTSGKLVGVVSERDLLRASLSALSAAGSLERRAFLHAVEISRVMSHPPITIHPDASVEEAALIDGATPTQAFIRVMLPLARPALAVTALFGFLAGWNEYIFAQTLLFDESMYTAPVGIFSLQDSYRQPWGWFAASSLIVSVPVVILFLYLQRNLISGLAAGGVKG